MVENVLQKVIENNEIRKHDELRKKVLADSRNMFEIRIYLDVKYIGLIGK